MPLPKTDQARVDWTFNCEAEFPAIAAVTGFTPVETEEVLKDCVSLRFAIQQAQKGAAYSKATTSYKYWLLGKTKDGTNPPDVPVLKPLTEPAELSDPGILKRFEKWEERLKAHPNYNDSVGDILMVNTAKTERPSEQDAKPTGQATAKPGSSVIVDWVKGLMHGVTIESQRGDETVWTKLDSDYRSPYEDDRPPLVAGKPEERRYRLRYILNDEPYGEFSDVLVCITKP